MKIFKKWWFWVIVILAIGLLIWYFGFYKNRNVTSPPSETGRTSVGCDCMYKPFLIGPLRPGKRVKVSIFPPPNGKWECKPANC